MSAHRYCGQVAAALIAVVAPAVGVGQACPPLRNQAATRIAASLGFDAANGLFTYRYEVSVDASSLRPLESFVVEAPPTVTSIAKPAGWGGNAVHWDARRTHIGGDWVWWDALRLPRPRKGRLDSSLIQPGASMPGFAFQSPKPPGFVRYYAVDYRPPATPDQPCAALGADENDVDACTEELHQRCPQLELDVLQQAASGGTIGPVDATPVHVVVKPGNAPAPVNPAAQGVLPVAILGSSSFDVRSVEASSVRLGLGRAVSRSGAHVEDVNADGIPDLMFQFPIQDAGIRCGDTVVVLAGATKTGGALSGFDTIRTVDCR